MILCPKKCCQITRKSILDKEMEAVQEQMSKLSRQYQISRVLGK